MGVSIEITKPGDDKNYPKKGDTVKINYVGKLTTGEVFDKSETRGKPFETKIGVGKVIRGWDEAVPQMSLGEKATLHITADYGYGASGFPNLIPPNSDLIFEVHLYAINDMKDPSA